MDIAFLKRQLIQFCHRMYDKGWVANHDGNATIRISPQRFLATPTAQSKGDLTEDMLLLLDEQGKVVEGTHKPFSEINLHLALYAQRKDISCVLHAHPLYATSFAMAGQAIDVPYSAEVIVSLGDSIPLVPYALPGSPQSSELLAPAFSRYHAALLENHGVLTCGVDLAQAFYRMELVEHYAAQIFHARLLGALKPLPEADAQELMAKRRKAGLDPSAENSPWQGKAANSPQAAVKQPAAGNPAEDALRALIEEEVHRALSGLAKA